MTLLVEPDASLAETLSFALGEEVRHVESTVAAARDIDEHGGELLVVLGPGADLQPALDLAATWQLERPHIGVVLMRRRIDVHVLGQALRAGIREVVGADDLGALVAAARRSLEISRRRLPGDTEAGASGSEGKVITVFSAKGGCGKTTVATNLAGVVAAGEKRVCVVDLDLEFGDVAIALQLVPGRTIVDAVPMLGTMDEHGVQSLVTSHGPYLDTVLAPVSPGQNARVDVKVVPELVRVLRRMYDVVVLDTPPAFTEHVLASFDVSDTYVLLATLDVPAVKNLKLSLETLEVLGYPRDRMTFVLNRADSEVGLEVEEVERVLRTDIAVRIPSSGDVPSAVNRGQLLVQEQPEHPVSRAIQEIAVHAHCAPGPAPVAGRGRTGLRGLLRRGGTR